MSSFMHFECDEEKRIIQGNAFPLRQSIPDPQMFIFWHDKQ